MSWEQMVLDFHEKQNISPETLYTNYVENIKLQITRGILHELAKYLYERSEPKCYRMHLILQETEELCDALLKNNKVGVADASADLIYVTIGTAIHFQIPISKVLEEVHRSNMTKTNVMKEGRGKENYDPPKIGEILDEHA